MATSPPTNGNGNGNQLPPLPPPPEQSPRWPEGALPRRQAQAEYVAGGGNWIAENPYYRSLPTYIDDITHDFGSDAYERVMLDDQVASSVRTYVESILSDPLTVRPWIDDDKDPDYEESKQYAEFAERLLANCSPTRSVDALLFEMTMGSVSLGNRVAEKVARLEESGQDAGRLVWDRVKVKPRNRTAFVVDGFSNLLGLLAAIPGQGNLVPGAILTPDLLAVSNLLPREKFAILSWDPKEEDPRGTSLLRTVYRLWWEKIQATAEWLKHLTQFGSPSLWGTTAPDAMAEPATDSLGNVIPGAASITPVQQLLNEFLKFRNGYALALPNGATVQLLQSANAGDAFLKMVEHHERAIDRAILLAARTRMEAKHGSKADSETSQDITGQAVRRAKTWVADMVTRDLIRPMILWNFGPDAAKRLCPYASLAPVEHQDWSQTANALAPLVSVGFLKPSQFAAMYDKLGLPPAEEPLTDDQQQDATPPPAPGDEDSAAGNPDEAPFAAGEYEETKHPRGYGGKWANKPGSESDPASNEAVAAAFLEKATNAPYERKVVLAALATALASGVSAVKPYDVQADRALLHKEDGVRLLKRLAARSFDAIAPQATLAHWEEAKQDGWLRAYQLGLRPEQKALVQAKEEQLYAQKRRALQRLKTVEKELHARPEAPRQQLSAQNLDRAVVVSFSTPHSETHHESPREKQVQSRPGYETVAGLLKVLPQADVLGLHAARVYFLPAGLKVEELNSIGGVYAQSLAASTKKVAGESTPAGILWEHSAAPVQVPVDQVPPDARYGGQSQRGDTGTFEPAKVDQYKRLSKSLYVHQKAGEELAYDIVLAKEAPRLIGIPKHLVAEFAEYEEHRHPRGYGGKWANKAGDHGHEQHTAAFEGVSLDSDEALPWLEHYHRQGQHPPEWPAALPLPEEPIDLEALAQEVRLGQAAERVEQALEAHRVAPEGLTSWTQEDLDNARAALQEARQEASLVSFSQEEADQDEPGLSVEAQTWFEAVEDGRVSLVEFGLPHPYEEHKHPRGYGGRWTNKPGAAAAATAHQVAEKNLRKHETNLGKLAAKVGKLHQAHAAAKAAHAAAKKRVPKGKPHSREALEAHKAELAAIRAKGKLDAAKGAHSAAKKDHAAAKKEHTRTAKALEKMKHEEPSRVRPGGPGSPAKSDKAGRSVAPEARGTTAPAVDRERAGGDLPARPAAPARVPVTVAEATRRIDRYAGFFQEKGQEEQARWMEMLRDHVQAVGTSAALQSLGEEIVTGGGPREEIQYQGAHEEMSQFADHYLRRHGITPLVGSAAPTEATQRFISSWTPAEEPVPAGRSGAGDFKPRDPTLANKLEEAKHLPGLESSEDIAVLMGKPVTHLDSAVSARMDEQYGKGQWIIKAYGEDAFAGFGIFFPQRVTQLVKDAQDTIWNAGERLATYGLSLRRQDGKVVGLEHQDGRRFDFGSADYQQHIYGDARHLGDKVAQVADNEHGVALRDRDGHINGKHWMAQPAFPVVGVSEAERAQGVTIKKGSEGRVHLVTRDGNVEVVPHATWLKEEHLPVVFENEDTRAMAEAARKAIAALPDSERQGQVYAPDVVKTAQGFRVIEANPEAKGGGSGYLEDNPFIIDSYISHLVGREPAHVTFLRDLLT